MTVMMLKTKFFRLLRFEKELYLTYVMITFEKLNFETIFPYCH